MTDPSVVKAIAASDAIIHQPHDEFAGDVLRVRGAAAIPGDHQLTAGLQGTTR